MDFHSSRSRGLVGIGNTGCVPKNLLPLAHGDLAIPHVLVKQVFGVPRLRGLKGV